MGFIWILIQIACFFFLKDGDNQKNLNDDQILILYKYY